VIDDLMPRAGEINMAIDELLLQTAHVPILRFYRWRKLCVSFGYFGRFEEAQAFARGRPLVRRWTGGGIVPHGGDLTYSIMIGSADESFARSSRVIYRSVHSAIEHALHLLGVCVVLAEKDAPRISEACFANPVAADVLEGGQKIAGAAQRRTRQGLLHQGSIQRSGLGNTFGREMARALGDQILEEQIGSPLLAAANILASQKYANDAWLRRH
jgi:lipoate-protein ligase A